METPSNIFKSFLDLRVLLTSNFHWFNDVNKFNEVKLIWNGDTVNYEFKASTVDFWIEVNYYGFPEFGVRGEIEPGYMNEFIIDSIYEINHEISNYINDKEPF